MTNPQRSAVVLASGTTSNMPPDLTIVIWNQKLGERIDIPGPVELVDHLHKRMKERGHYLLDYDDITFTRAGHEFKCRGPYLLLHILTGVRVPGWPW